MPAAIRYGISFDTFWRLNPKYIEIYQESYIKSVKEKYEFADFRAWKHGEYMISAIQKAIEPKKATYPSQPFSRTEEQSVQSSEIQSLKFDDWAKAWNKKFEQSNFVGTE